MSKTTAEINEALDAIKRLEQLIKESEKTAASATETMGKSFEKMGETVKKSTEKSSVGLKEFGEKIKSTADSALPKLTSAIKLFGGETEQLNGIFQKVSEGANILTEFGEIAKSAEDLSKGFGTAKETMSQFIDANGAAAVATAASTAGIGLKEVAVGLLTGQITLATAAQTLWNMAMNSNPIGLIVAGITAAIAAIALLVDWMTGSSEKAEEYAKSQERLANAYVSGTEKALAWKDAISGARNLFSDFNDEILISADKQSEITAELNEVQSTITEIARKGMEERGYLNEEELKRMDELFARMRELSEQELKIQESYMNAAKTQAEVLANNQNISVEAYQQEAQSILQTAEEKKAQIISLAEQQYTEELALLSEKYQGESVLTNEEYAREAAAAEQDRQQKIESAKLKNEEIIGIVRDGYAARLVEDDGFYQKYQELATQSDALEAERQEKLLESAERHRQLVAEGREDEYTAQQNFQNECDLLNAEYNEKMKEHWQTFGNGLSDSAIANAEILLQMVMDSEQNYHEMDENTQQMVQAMLAGFSTLDEDGRDKLNKAFENMGIEINQNGDILYTSGENTGGKVIQGFEAADLSARLPENAQVSLSAYIRQLESQEAINRASNAGGKVANSAASGASSQNASFTNAGIGNVSAYLSGLNSFRNLNIGGVGSAIANAFLPKKIRSLPGEMLSAMAAQMRRAVSGETARFASMISGSGMAQALRMNPTIQNHIAATPVQIQTTARLEIDGREFAVANAPYMSEELEWLNR